MLALNLSGASRTKTFASAELSDVDGVKTSAATATSEATVLPAAMDGAGINTSGAMQGAARTVTATLSNAIGSYSTSPIVVTGRRGGQIVTDNLTPPDADGNVTLFGTQPFDTLTSIVIPAQVDTSGAISFGVGDICAPAGDTFAGIKVDTQITVHCQFGEGSAAVTDASVFSAREVEPVRASRVLTGTSETSGAAVTVYFGE